MFSMKDFFGSQDPKPPDDQNRKEETLHRIFAEQSGIAGVITATICKSKSLLNKWIYGRKKIIMQEVSKKAKSFDR